MDEATLLVELHTEELPPKALQALGDAFADRIVEALAAADLVRSGATVLRFATPRRLAVSIADVLARAPDRVDTKRLMPAKVAYDASGVPTPALQKRLEKEGADAASLSRRIENGVEQVWLSQSRAGVTLAAGLQAALDESLAKLPIPKRMSYQRYGSENGGDEDGGGSETTVQFVRPAHSLVALHGATVVPVEALGLAADRVTAGHRFLGMRHVTLKTADDYADVLERDGKVIASFAARRDTIRTCLQQEADGQRVVMPDALVDEVTSLVEWPVVLGGTFDARFLEVPAECLILTMQQNQKYFALTDASGTLVNRFLLVSNIEASDSSAIVGGNERVLRARLADARFFFDQDRKRSLESRVDGLKTVVYHNQLGTQFNRMQRVRALAGRIASLIGSDPADAERAATIAKADLLTDMVGEFPELQGLMGRYYAVHDGEKADVAAAIDEQYQPRFAGDALPATSTGTALALADKLETMAGLFGIGAVPTGDKDPFALRRHALGVVRMLVEKGIRIEIGTLVDAAVALFPDARSATGDELRAFIETRLAGYCRDLGYSTNEVEAVVHGQGPIADVPKRLEAVRAFSKLPQAASLASAGKRVRNILGKSDEATGQALDVGLFVEDAEIALHRALLDSEPLADRAFDDGDYTSALMTLATLKEPVDLFFTQVMVNSDDAAVRINRLGLLAHLHAAMNRVADLSKLAS